MSETRIEQRLLEAVTETMPSVVYLLDISTGRYVYMNTAIERLIGLTVSEVMTTGQDAVLSRMHPDDAPRVMEKHLKAVERVATWPLPEQDRYVHVDEYRLRHNDGTWRWIRSTARVFERAPDGGIRSILGTAQDITENKELEARLRLSDRMASAGLLASGVAHEINNPLAHLTASLELFAEELERISPEIPLDLDRLARLRTMGAGMNESASRIGRIVRDLKTFSRADDETLGAVSVDRAIDSVLPLIRNEIRHRAKLVLHYGNPPPVQANEGRLAQVILNLLINAAQAIPEGAAGANEIRILTGVQGPQAVFIEIQDTGTGIREEHLKRIFEPFFTTKPIGIGTGLGLAICEQIVRSFGGEIRAASELGNGASFRVLLPAAAFASPSRTDSTSSGEAESGSRSAPAARILVVDDEPSIAQIIAEALGEHEVRIATSGRQAWEELAGPRPRPDLILCDLMMPEITGPELYGMAGKLAGELQRRFVFLTGGALSGAAQEFLWTTGNAVIQKPFRVRAIRELVRSELDRLSRRNPPCTPQGDGNPLQKGTP